MRSHNSSEGENRKRAIEHAKGGYQNAQEIARFIDTKSSFITGASTVSIGFVLNALKEYIQLPSPLRHNVDQFPILTCWIAVLAVISLFAGVLCLWQSIMSLIGRPPSPLDNRPTVLFPFYSETPKERSHCQKIVSGLSEKEIAQEYETQIRNVGLILRKKFIRHRSAGWLLLMQLTSITAAGILVICCLYYGYILQ